MTQRERNRALVQDFYRMAFQENRPDEACRRYVGDPYVQHSPIVSDGTEGFIRFFEEWSSSAPTTYRQEIHRIVADETLVAVHATLHDAPDGIDTQLVDLFRIENEKIVEHWDVFMEIPDPAQVPHDNGTYQGTEMGLRPFERANGDDVARRNLAVVREFYQMCFVEKRYAEAADRFFGERYVQHNPFVEDGIEGFKKEFVNSVERRSRDYVQNALRFVGDENGVAVHETIHEGAGLPGYVLIDIFRVQDGAIVEHWDVYMTIPEPSTVPHGNGVL